MAKDPVCGMTVDDKKSEFKSENGGDTYYFCSVSCKQKFDADPRKYVLWDPTARAKKP